MRPRPAGRWREPLYVAGHQALTAWARWRYRRDFDGVDRFCIFVGYARSGSSIVAAILNAHRHAVIAHELNIPALVLRGCARDELYARILARSLWFAWWKRNASNYDYAVSGQWQGRYDRLRVIGDKRAGSFTRQLGRHPDLLDRLAAIVGVPLRLVHVVRNPWDNIAALCIWNGLPLGEAIPFYFAHCDVIAGLLDREAAGEMLTVRHEALISRPRETVTELCGFAGLDAGEAFVEACARKVFGRPTLSRQRIAWTEGAVRDVARRARQYPFLGGYGFDAAGPAV